MPGDTRVDARFGGDAGAPLGHVAMIGASALYAVGLIEQKALVAGHAPQVVIFWQMGLAATLLWAATLALDGAAELFSRRSALLLGWGVWAPGASLMLNMAGAAQTDGITMMVIWGLLPLVAPLISPILIGESWRWDVILGGGVAFVGVVVAATGREAQGWSTLAGIAMVSGAVLMAGLGFVFGRFMNRGGGPWRRSAALQVSGAAVVSAAVLAASGGPAGPPAAGADAARLAYLVLGMTFANFLMFNFALARIPVAWVSLYTALGPVVGAVAAWALLGSPVRPLDAAMIAVVSAGVGFPHLLRALRTRG